MKFVKAKKDLKVKLATGDTVTCAIELLEFEGSTAEEKDAEQVQYLGGNEARFNVATKAIHSTQKQSGRAYGANFDKVPEGVNKENWITTVVIPKIQEIVRNAKPNTGISDGLTGAQAKDKLSLIRAIPADSTDYAAQVAAIMNG